MNLEKFLELVFNNPDNISVEYSNINGKEKLTVNGEDILNNPPKTFDDTLIKEKVKLFKKNVEHLDEWIWDLVIDKAKDELNLEEMDKILNKESYTEQEALQADNTIRVMSEFIKDILKQEVQSLVDLMERF